MDNWIAKFWAEAPLPEELTAAMVPDEVKERWAGKDLAGYIASLNSYETNVVNLGIADGAETTKRYRQAVEILMRPLPKRVTSKTRNRRPRIEESLSLLLDAAYETGDRDEIEKILFASQIELAQMLKCHRTTIGNTEFWRGLKARQESYQRSIS